MGNRRSWHSKARVITSAVLTASLVMSGMSANVGTSIAYAATDTDLTSGDNSVTGSSNSAADASSTEEEGETSEANASGSGSSSATEEISNSNSATEEISDSSESSNEASSELSNEASSESSDEASTEDSEETTVTPSEDEADDTTSTDYSIDVWDFGAEQLEGVNNILTVDVINGFYDSSITAGSTGVNIADFTAGDLSFEDGGYSTTHRLRTINESLTRYDNKSKTDADGNTYNGFIYSNKSATDAVYLSLEMEEDEQVTFYAGSNGNASIYYFVNMDDESDVQTASYSGVNGVEPLTFYAKQDGTYKLYNSNEKLVVARVIRTQASYVTLSGLVSGFEDTEGVSLVFENQSNGKLTTASVDDEQYSVSLASGYTYDVSLEGADAYVITDGSEVTVGDSDQTLDVAVEAVDLVTYAGEITGIASEDIENFVSAAEFTFVPQDEKSVFVPEISMTASDTSIAYEVTLQNDVTYDVT
nr:hypothetical protein [Butyrivibrio sp.]